MVNRSNKSLTGFTLLELIVAMAIVAVLATLAIGAITIVQRSARDAERRSALETMNLEIEGFRGDTGSYPGFVGRVTGSTTQVRICATSACNSTSDKTINLKGAAIMLSNTSATTTTSEGTVYCYLRTGAAYSLGVNLESGNNFYLGSGTNCSFSANRI